MELRATNQSQSLYTRALTSAWRLRTQTYDPSAILLRDPEAEEKMLRDADIMHAVGHRCHLIAGRQWTVVPEIEESPRADMSVAVATRLLKCIEYFTASRQNLARAFFSGARFATIHGESREMPIGDGVVRTWWVPTRLEDEDKRIYRIVPTTTGNKVTAHWEHWNIALGRWEPRTSLDMLHTIRHVYQDDQATLGYGRGLREAVGWWWYTKTHVFQESITAIERFAQGIIHAKIDGARDAKTGLPNEQLINDWVEVLKDVRARHVLVSDRSDEVEIIQGSGTGWEMLSSMADRLTGTIRTLILSANLPTGAEKGGSYALADVQEDSTESLVQFDRETMEESLTKQLLGCLWYRNHANMVELGIDKEKPRFNIRQEKKLDPEVRANVASTLHGMGVDLAKDDLYEQTGFRRPQEGEDVIEGATEPDPTLLGAGIGGGLGGDDPDGKGALPFKRRKPRKR